MFDTSFQAAADKALGQMKQAFEAFTATPGKLPSAPAIQEFATRATDAAKASLAEAQTATLAAAATVEKAAAAMTGTGTTLVRQAIDATVAQGTLAADAARDVLRAPTLQAAMERQAAFLKDSADAQTKRLEAGVTAVAEGAATLRAETEAAMSSLAKTVAEKTAAFKPV